MRSKRCALGFSFSWVPERMIEKEMKGSEVPEMILRFQKMMTRSKKL